LTPRSKLSSQIASGSGWAARHRRPSRSDQAGEEAEQQAVSVEEAGAEESRSEEASRRQDGVVDNFDGGDGEGVVGIGCCTQGGRQNSIR
jgi:hypothetical protein